MGAAGLLQTRRFRSGQTLRRRRRRLLFTGGLRCVKPCEGDRGDAGRRSAAGWSASEGGAPGPRQGGVTTPAPGRRSSSDAASRCLSPYVLRAWGAETSWQGIASGATASCHRRLPSRRQAPEAASEQQQNPMDGSSPPGPRSGRGANRRGGEKPRGRSEPGEASPGDTDPSAHVVEGEQNPRRGGLGREAGARTAEQCPEEGPSLREPLRIVVPRGTPRPEQTGRRNTSWPNITAGRVRRTDVAATSDGVELREAG